MGSRRSLTWLIVSTISDDKGKEIALLGRASYDPDDDMLTVTTLTPTGREAEEAEVRGHPMQPLAKLLLWEMYRDGRITS